MNVADTAYEQFMKKSIWRRILDALLTTKYCLKCWLKPNNVVRISALPRTWVDRDEVLFHAAFQVLVDFVELEHAFSPYDGSTRRVTDRVAMSRFIEKNFKNASESYYYPGMTATEKDTIDTRMREQYLKMREILELYIWYKDERYEEFDARLDAPNPFEGNTTLKNNMLKRLIDVRQHLWT